VDFHTALESFSVLDVSVCDAFVTVTLQ